MSQPKIPAPEPVAMTEGELWSWTRSVMCQGADIRVDYDMGNHKGYEAYSARLDAAAAERSSAMWARLETYAAAREQAARVQERETQAADSAEWQSIVFTLMGHASVLYSLGQQEMPAWFDALAEKIARAHVDEETAKRVAQVAANQGRKAPDPRRLKG